MSSIICSQLSFAWPDDTTLFDDLTFTVPAGRTGLVASNGAGKSTLLKLIAGQLQPSRGAVTVDGSVGYLPQALPFATDLTVAELLGIAPVFAALEALTAGDASEGVFAVIGEDWDIEERAAAQLARLGLDVTLDRKLATLSGGEVITLGLAAQLLTRPDVLLLDEPTNNVDPRCATTGFTRSCRAIPESRWWSAMTAHCWTGWTGSPSCTRRNPFLRRQFQRIPGQRGACTAAAEARCAQCRTATQTRKAPDAAGPRTRRPPGRHRRPEHQERRTAENHGGQLKRNAQESAAATDDVHTKRVDDARARLDDAERALPRR